MKRWIFIAFLAVLCQAATAQKNDSFYSFDKNWNGVDINQASYLVRVRKNNDKEFVVTTYQIYGPRISQETSQDEKATIRNGDCRYYHSNGYMDSLGRYDNNLQEGDWWFYDEKGKAYKKRVYERGNLMKDSAFDSSVKVDSVSKLYHDPIEVESIFKGGPKGWMKFLNANFQYPARAQNSNKEGMVLLDFIVDEHGNVQHPEINKSAEYSMDEEALRLIRLSPAWVPATQDGKVVKSYKRQPFIFKLTN